MSEGVFDVDDCGDRLIELSPERSVVRVKIEERYSCLHGGYQVSKDLGWILSEGGVRWDRMW